MKKNLKSKLTLSALQVKNIYSQAELSSELLKPLFFNRCFDKNRIKLLVSWSLKNCGQKITIDLIENLKNLGFRYATEAGISLGIDDLRIPATKNVLIATAEKNIKKTNINSKQEYLTGIEKFQHLIDTWHKTSEVLKQDVIANFQLTDVFNPVYMMAFSGARGNVSQVRQLVGMRGLMSDPQGQILDFPIKSNFREGITLTEYIISCYGARKGLVDTALKTANSGYLTRRLVDVCHHIIVCDFDCKTKRGVFISDIFENKKIIVPLQNRLIGRILAENIYTDTSSSISKKTLPIASLQAHVSDSENLKLLFTYKKKGFFIGRTQYKTNQQSERELKNFSKFYAQHLVKFFVQQKIKGRSLTNANFVRSKHQLKDDFSKIDELNFKQKLIQRFVRLSKKNEVFPVKWPIALQHKRKNCFAFPDTARGRSFCEAKMISPEKNLKDFSYRSGKSLTQLEKEKNVLQIKLAVFFSFLVKNNYNQQIRTKLGISPTSIPINPQLNYATLAAHHVVNQKQFSLFLDTILQYKPKFIAKRNQEVSVDLAKKIAFLKKSVFVRSPLTCEIKNSICQLCYGWSLAHGKLVSLGEAVGVVAAQSIGEPGTQLTMRTFHTGGVFSGDVMTEIVAPFSGKIIFDDLFPGMLIRTPHGQIAFLTKAQGSLKLEAAVDEPSNKKNLLDFSRPGLNTKKKNFYSHTKQSFKRKNTIFQIPALCILFVRNQEYVTKGQSLAEFSLMAADANQRIQASHDLNAEIEGEVLFKSLLLLTLKNGKTKKIISRTACRLGCIWILSGKICMQSVPITLFSQPGDLVDKNSILAQYEIMSSYSGFISKHEIPTRKNTNFVGHLTQPHNPPYYCFTKAFSTTKIHDLNFMPSIKQGPFTFQNKSSEKLRDNFAGKTKQPPLLKNRVFSTPRISHSQRPLSKNWLEYPLLSYSVELFYYKRIGYFFSFFLYSNRTTKNLQLDSHKCFLSNSRNHEFKNSRYLNKNFFFKVFPQRYETETGGQLIYDNFYLKKKAGEVFWVPEETHFFRMSNSSKNFINYLTKTSSEDQFEKMSTKYGSCLNSPPGKKQRQQQFSVSFQRNTKKFISKKRYINFYYNSQGKFSVCSSKLFGYTQSFVVLKPTCNKSKAQTLHSSFPGKQVRENSEPFRKSRLKFINLNNFPVDLCATDKKNLKNSTFYDSHLGPERTKKEHSFFPFARCFATQRKKNKVFLKQSNGTKPNLTKSWEVDSQKLRIPFVGNSFRVSKRVIYKTKLFRVYNALHKINENFKNSKIYSFHYKFHQIHFNVNPLAKISNPWPNQMPRVKKIGTIFPGPKKNGVFSFYGAKQRGLRRDAALNIVFFKYHENLQNSTQFLIPIRHKNKKFFTENLCLEKSLHFSTRKKNDKIDIKLLTKQRLTFLQPYFPWKVFTKKHKKIKINFESYFFFNEKEKKILSQFYINSSVALLRCFATQRKKTSFFFHKGKKKLFKNCEDTSYSSEQTKFQFSVNFDALYQTSSKTRKTKPINFSSTRKNVVVPNKGKTNRKHIKNKLKYFKISYTKQPPIEQIEKYKLKDSKYIKIKIKPGWMYFPPLEQTKNLQVRKSFEIHKKHEKIIKPGTICFDTIVFDQYPVYCQCISMGKISLIDNKYLIKKNINLQKQVQFKNLLKKFQYTEQSLANTYSRDLQNNKSFIGSYKKDKPERVENGNCLHFEVRTLKKWFFNLFSLKLRSSLLFQLHFDISQLYNTKKTYKNKFHLIIKRVLVKTITTENLLTQNLDKIYFLKNTNFTSSKFYKPYLGLSRFKRKESLFQTHPHRSALGEVDFQKLPKTSFIKEQTQPKNVLTGNNKKILKLNTIDLADDTIKFPLENEKTKFSKAKQGAEEKNVNTSTRDWVLQNQLNIFCFKTNKNLDFSLQQIPLFLFEIDNIASSLTLKKKFVFLGHSAAQDKVVRKIKDHGSVALERKGEKIFNFFLAQSTQKLQTNVKHQTFPLKYVSLPIKNGVFFGHSNKKKSRGIGFDRTSPKIVFMLCKKLPKFYAKHKTKIVISLVSFVESGNLLGKGMVESHSKWQNIRRCAKQRNRKATHEIIFLIISKVKSYSLQTVTQYKKLLAQQSKVPTGDDTSFSFVQQKIKKIPTVKFPLHSVLKLRSINKQIITHLFRHYPSPDFYLKLFFKFPFSSLTFGENESNGLIKNIFCKKTSILQYNIIFIIPKNYKSTTTKIFFGTETKQRVFRIKNFPTVNKKIQSNAGSADFYLFKRKKKPYSNLLTSFNVSMFVELETSSQNLASKHSFAPKRVSENKKTLTKMFSSSQNHISLEMPVNYTNLLSRHYGEILYSGLYRNKDNSNTKEKNINTVFPLDKTKKQNYLILTSGEQITFAIRNLDSKFQTPLPCQDKFDKQQNTKSRYTLGDSISYGAKLSQNLVIPVSGVIIQIQKLRITVRKAQPLSFSAKGLVSVYEGDIIEKNTLIMRLFYQRLKTGDIVQGIPRIEQLFEARKTNQGELLSGSLHQQLEKIFLYYIDTYNFSKAARYSLEKIQQIIVSSVQKVYRSQGVIIADKHLEIIIRQMTSKVEVIESGHTSLLPGEIVDLDWIEVVNKGMNDENTKAKYVPIILGITRKSLETKSFISEASFQETTRVLTKSSIERRTDFLKGLKENVILGHLVPAGTGFYSNTALHKKMFPSIKTPYYETEIYESYNIFRKIFSPLLVNPKTVVNEKTDQFPPK